MIKLRSIYHMIIVIAICLQAYTGLAGLEIYPFSKFPMYNGRIYETNFIQCTALVKLKNKDELIPYRKVGTTFIQYLFQHTVCAGLNGVSEDFIPKERYSYIASEYFNGVRKKHKKKIEKIVFIVNKWKKVSYENVNNPDEQIVLYEKDF